MTAEPPPPLTARQWRLIAAIVAGVVLLALVIVVACPRAGFVNGSLVAIFLPVQFFATRVGFRMWRGEISHAVITYVPPSATMSLRRFQAASPCGIVAADGFIVAYTTLITVGIDGPVGAFIGFAGTTVALSFAALGLIVAITMRPRFLLPGTMRREMSA